MKYFNTFVISFVSVAGFCLGQYLFEKWKPTDKTAMVAAAEESVATLTKATTRIRPYDIPGSDTPISNDEYMGITVNVINNPDLGLFIVVRHHSEIISIAETHASTINEGRQEIAKGHLISYDKDTEIEVFTVYAGSDLHIVVRQHGAVISSSPALVQ